MKDYERGKGGSVSPVVYPYISADAPPTEFEYCLICRMFHHPHWHVLGWRDERREAGDRRALTRHTPDRRRAE